MPHSYTLRGDLRRGFSAAKGPVGRMASINGAQEYGFDYFDANNASLYNSGQASIQSWLSDIIYQKHEVPQKIETSKKTPAPSALDDIT